MFHQPPPAKELAARLAAMCAFANGETPKGFLHPALRAIILHFWLAFDHPFVDGNGRTARALFYWSMLNSRYWLFEFISISQIILKRPNKYYRAFLHTETDDYDLSYFVLYQLAKLDELNHRQRALISHAIRKPGTRYTVESHRASHNVVYETARSDLLDLVERKLLEKKKSGKKLIFIAVPELQSRLT